MERRKFLANLVCLGVGVSLAPKVIMDAKLYKPSVDPRVFDYPVTKKECYGPPDNFVIGCITSLSDDDITVYPYSGLEEFPALKKGDKAILFRNYFSETTTETAPRYSHKEKDAEHYIIIVQEDVPCAGKGLPITFQLNRHSLSHVRLYDRLIFVK